MSSHEEYLARIAWRAYTAVTIAPGEGSWASWEDLGENGQAGWVAAVTAVADEWDRVQAAHAGRWPPAGTPVPVIE